MISPKLLAQIPFFRGLPARPLSLFAEEAMEVTLEPNALVVHQHDEARHVYFLLSGTVQFLLQFQGTEDLIMGVTSEPGALIGWSAFRAPYRYSASVRCEQSCRFVRLSRKVFDDVILSDPRLGYDILHRVAMTVADRMEQARDLLVRSTARSEAGKC
jgi:CRP-like cAMP-binding protein